MPAWPVWVQCLALPPHRAVYAGNFRVKERRIVLLNLWAEEYLDLTYWRYGDYLVDPLADYDYLLRDWRNGKLGEIFRTVFDQLFWLNHALRKVAPLSTISGFRSESINDMLSETSEGVAADSLHIHGMAIEVCVAGVTRERNWQSTVELGMGRNGL